MASQQPTPLGVADTDQTARRARLAVLQQKLKSRTDSKGLARPGYQENVELIREKITSLEARIAQVEAHENPQDFDL